MGRRRLEIPEQSLHEFGTRICADRFALPAQRCQNIDHANSRRGLAQLKDFFDS
jgi:hypothetical protein